jgi:hypothetical protein
MRYSYQKNIKVGRARLIHIETPLGIINIRPGLTDATGRRVDSVEVIPNNYSGEPRVMVAVNTEKWPSLNARLIEDRAEEPA